MTFEEKLQNLEDIIKKLENETISLDESVKLYQEAKKLSKELNDELNDSMKKLSFVVEDGQIKPLDLNELKKDI